MGTVIQTEAEIDRLMASPAPPCTCCSTPATPPGAAPTRPRSRSRYRSRIGHVHAKDVREAVMRQATTEDW